MNRHLPSRPVRSIAVLALALAVTAGACDCDSSGFRHAEPKLVVDPTSFSIDGVPGKFTEHLLRVSNEGSSPLNITSVVLLNDQGGEHTKFAIVQKLVENCEEELRPAGERNEIMPSQCALVRFRYLPTDDGIDTGVIIIESNDPDNPTLTVPINGNSQTPTLQVCAFEGDTEIGCNTPGATFEVDFGLSAPGSPVARTLKLKSKGSRPVDIEEMQLTGDSDFTVSPDTFRGTLSPGQEETLAVTFNALIGGSRDARLIIKNNDPIDERLEVRLRAIGDGSKMCLCVENSVGRCVPTAVADFGRTAEGGTRTLNMRIASCGTKPLELTRMRIDGEPIFGMEAPDLPLTMPPGPDYLEVPLTFSPTAQVEYEGRVDIETSEEEGFVSLVGRGYQGGCNLTTPSPTLDFGSVAMTYAGERKLTLVNQGDEDCLIKGPDASNPAAGAHVSAGADVEFSLVGLPSELVVRPSTTLAFTLAYKPKSMQGSHVGEFTVPYSGESGSPVSELKVQLKGTPVAEPTCTLTVAPDGSRLGGRAVNFGQVRILTEKVMPVTFTNVGSGDCKINNARLSGMGMPGMPADTPYFKIKKQARTPLPPGQSTTVEVAFTPDIARGYGSADIPPIMPSGFTPGSVTLMVNTDDIVSFPATGGGGGFPPFGNDTGGCGPTAGAGCVGWDLSGTGAKSDIAVLPHEIDFGLVTFGCNSREEIVTLYNIGTLNATITAIQIDPEHNPAVFKVTGPRLPYTLSGGTPLQLKVKYKPRNQSGIDTATIRIISDATNAGAANDITIPVRGEATTDTHVVDVFDQSKRPKTDVLFVVDDSGSMQSNQSALAGNMSTFINVANDLDTDFQVGVVTTDVEVEPGVFRYKSPSPKIIKSDNPNAAADLARTIRDLGTNGSADERALESMVAALSPPNITDPALNGGFLRADGKLAVVVVGDEDDHSNGSVDFYIDFLRNIKGVHNAGMVSFSVIGGPEGGCATSEHTPRLIKVQEEIGGSFRSICSSDWGQIAADIGLDAFGARAGFPLSREAVANTIEVEVDRTPSRKPDWAYEALPNTVVFTPAKLPDPSASIVIEYEALCRTDFDN